MAKGEKGITVQCNQGLSKICAVWSNSCQICPVCIGKIVLLHVPSLFVGNCLPFLCDLLVSQYFFGFFSAEKNKQSMTQSMHNILHIDIVCIYAELLKTTIEWGTGYLVPDTNDV